MFRYFNLLFLLFIFNIAAAQDDTSQVYPYSYFRYPLDLSPIIAGNFGELRSNHFHSGLDFKTNQREGYPVYAAADGYVSRIRVQIGGGGNALYLTHPNGYTTVYMHLQRYNERITQTVKTYQYRKETFDVDFPLLPVEIPVKKGEIIAWSGNTGGSSGPHLHFEIRDTNTEETINPQLFGISIPDKVKPSISGIYLYRLNGYPFSEKTPKQYFGVSGAGGSYKLSPATIITINGESGFGIVTSDQNSASSNSNGPYAIELSIDGQMIYTSRWEKFSFANSRAINSHLDYPSLIASGRRIQKSFIEPGNPLQIYKGHINNGVVDINDAELHDARYTVRDVAGNESVLNFKIRYSESAPVYTAESGSHLFKHNETHELDTNGMRISIPKNTLYSDLNFSYSSSPAPAGAYSMIHHVHNRMIPVHNPYMLSIKTDGSLRRELQSKALIVNINRAAQGGTYENGSVTASVRALGSFFVTVDTVAPRITPVNITNGKSFAGGSRIQFKISDNLSGIRSFTGRIDGKWVLMEYDAKTASLWHKVDEHTLPGRHDFQLVVTDMKGNSRQFEASFIR